MKMKSLLAFQLGVDTVSLVSFLVNQFWGSKVSPSLVVAIWVSIAIIAHYKEYKTLK